MMLPRKRQRRDLPESSGSSVASTPVPTPAKAPTPSTSSLDQPSTQQQQQTLTLSPSGSYPTAQSAQPLPMRQVRKSQSWYGSWPRAPKASASTSVARETIFGDSVKSDKGPDLGRFEPKNDVTDATGSQATLMEGNFGLPKVPEDEAADNPAEPDKEPKPTTSDSQQAASVDSAATAVDQAGSVEMPAPPRLATSSGWLGWWSKTPFTDTQPSTAAPPPESKDDMKVDEPERPVTPPAQTEDAEQAQGKPEQPVAAPQSTSWFGFWGASPARNNKPAPNPEPQPDIQTTDTTETASAAATPEPPPPTQDKLMTETPPKAGSTWAFWSKDSPKPKGNISSVQDPGEIAVIGEGSEAHPHPMAEGDVSNTPSKAPKEKTKVEEPKPKSTWRSSNKRVRPVSMDLESQASTSSGQMSPAKPGTPQPPSQADQPDSNKTAKANQSKLSKVTPEPETQTQMPTNLLLPSFTSTYQMKENPSIIKQIAKLLLRTQNPPANHVYRVNEPPKIRKAIAIGVHGLFPATYLRPMMGQPTGTSLRFAGLCADAIRRWTDSHGCADCEIEKVALEGEGKISERVDNLWKLLLNWIEHIRSADLVLIACHSQGVPVSIMLIEKLIDLGIVTSSRIGVCAMAGVSLGPFTDYKSSIFMGSAAELWEFGNPQSNNSQRFEAALKRVLDYGTRITFIGSIDDQVVPMESAIYSPANHPYIYRAAFIDGRIHAPDFIAHLVGFALKLRNLGISDHGLIRELSIPLAGSLYSGEGHSRLYYDSAVYDLAISHALETTSTPHPTPCSIQHHAAVAGTQPNPYVLPWIMRGLLEEDFVKTELSHETDELLRQFDAWKPVNKALKDVKYRLEAVRSKL
ncbi:hypothetical protein V2G26_020578 [Clonostachys chloroleuca]